MPPDNAALPRSLDVNCSSIARLHNKTLGGKDNFRPDQDLARQLEAVAPGQRRLAWANRRFQQRVLRYLAETAEIDQFVDLGAGLPVPGPANTHQIVGAVHVGRGPDGATVVYIDNDPVCIAHGHALLETDDRTHYVEGDLTESGLLLTPRLSTYLDMGKPIAVLLCGVLHYFSDSFEPAVIVRGWVDLLPPGSFVVITHFYTPGDCMRATRAAAACQKLYLDELGSGWFRRVEEVAGLFDGLRMVEPGVVELGQWWPGGPGDHRPKTLAERLMIGGVGRKLGQ